MAALPDITQFEHLIAATIRNLFPGTPRHSIDDLAQAARVRLLVGLQTFDPNKGTLHGFAKTLIIRACRDELRSIGNPPQELTESTGCTREDDPDDRALALQVLRAPELHLSPQHVRVLSAIQSHGSVEAAAAALGITKKSLTEMKSRLRSRISELFRIKNCNLAAK